MADRLGAAAWFARLRARGFRCPPGTTVAQLCASGPRAAAEALWHPLCLAALNTPPGRASGQVFANVLRAALGGRRESSDFLVPVTDLSALFPEPALRFVVQSGGRVQLRTAARIAAVDDGTVVVEHAHGRETFAAAVVAVGPHQLDAALGPHAVFAAVRERAAALTYEPIATAWLGYPARTALPARMVRLDDAPGQWVVDRQDVIARRAPAPGRPQVAQLLAVVISASGPHDALSPPALATACDAQLRRLVPALPPLAWSQTIVERRATYACVPQRPRAPSTLPHGRVALAGDWLDEEFPATLEAAVRTGVAAAFALEARHEDAEAR
jgi:hypothetical protein